MPSVLLVTLDVSRFSGWLNADASCPIARRMWRGRQEGLGGARARGGDVTVHAECTEELTGHWVRHARLGRTANMKLMVVTLDVSRLSGWLNADAPCRVAPRHVGGDTGGLGGARARGGGVAVHAACTEDRLDTGHGTRKGSAHVKHATHVRDAGCVEAQRLVER